MLPLIRRLVIQCEDAARNSKILRELLGWLYFFRGQANDDPIERSIHLTRALAHAETPLLSRLSTGEIAKNPGFEGRFTDWKQVVMRLPRYRTLIKESPKLDRSVVLKTPQSVDEKGVLLMTFEYNWVRLLVGMTDAEWASFEQRFLLVLSTSWSPTDYAALALVLSRTTGPVFVQSCNYSEIAKIEAFHPRLRCLPTLPCDWINPANYEPLPHAERDIDLIMIANWGKFKRHWELFQALARMPANLKVVLVGQREPGRSQDTLRSLARDFGVKQELEIYESIPIAEVSRLQCRAKVSVIMTRREGCCVAAVESLFANCALAMRDDAHVGPVEYINDKTGRRLHPCRLAEELMGLIRASSDMQPRAWAAQNVSNLVSLKKVNAFFREMALANDMPWSCDLLQPQWRPHPTFARVEDMEAMRPLYQELHQMYPAVISEDLLAVSWR